MMRKTHIAIGCVATSILIINTSIQPLAVIGILGSTFPDIDYKIGLEHRTITHSILMLILSSLLVVFFNKDIALVWFVNYSLHLIADSFTKMGVPFLYPFCKKRFGFKLIRTGSSIDYFITILCLYIFSEIIIAI